MGLITWKMQRPSKMPTLAQLYQQQRAQNQALQVASYFGATPTTGLNTGLAGWVTTSAATQTSTATTIPTWVGVVPGAQLYADTEQRLLRDIVITDGREHHIFLPDGTTILIGKDGSFTINDKDAKVTYRANRVRDFNSFVNASDRLEDFIRFCGEHGVKQDEMMNISIKHFIAWLIIEAAVADSEDVDTVAEQRRLANELRVQDRCRCGRFLKRKHIERRIAFCRPVCLERELAA